MHKIFDLFDSLEQELNNRRKLKNEYTKSYMNEPVETKTDIDAYMKKCMRRLDDYTTHKIEKIKDSKVRIPKSAIYDAIIDFFTDSRNMKHFVDGKYYDSYDLIRKFAMETIGVGENGELSPEFVEVVRQEVANFMTKKYDQTASADALKAEHKKGMDFAISLINRTLKENNYDIKFICDDEFGAVIVKEPTDAELEFAEKYKESLIKNLCFEPDKDKKIDIKLETIDENDINNVVNVYSDKHKLSKKETKLLNELLKTIWTDAQK